MKKKKLRILFFGIDFYDYEYIEINKEYQKLNDIIKKSNYKDYIELIPGFAIERENVQQKISENQPDIIHFSGHGSKGIGPNFLGDKQNSESDYERELLEILENYKDVIKIIFFNTCYTQDIAEKASEFNAYTIGVKHLTNPEGAIMFATSFYEFLSYGDTLLNSYNYAIEKYLHFFKERSKEITYHAEKEDYALFINSDTKIENLEDLLEINLWYDFRESFQESLKPILDLIIKLLFTQYLENKELYGQILKSYFNEQLSIPISLSQIKKALKDFELKESKSIIVKLIEEYREDNIYFQIKLEDLLTKVLSIVNQILQEFDFNFHIFTRAINIFISNLIKSEEIFKEIKPSDAKKINFRNRRPIELLKENFKRALIKVKTFNQSKINEFSPNEIKEYCRNQLELADLSSRYGYRYDENIFVEDPKLDSEFEAFYDNMEDLSSWQRIFLLLGHMGLGKTWNACHLAFKYVKKIPTFYFHLGSPYENDFKNLLGGFEKSRIREIINKFDEKYKKILVIFDGFDELLPIEREKFLTDLSSWIKENSEFLMVLLTSRLVDWVNTEEISRRYRFYKNYIFQSEKYNNLGEIIINTGSSYVLKDVENDDRLKSIIESYDLKFDQIQDVKLQKLMRKPFIVNLISKNNIDITKEEFDPKNDNWFNLFVNPKNEDTILRRMGIYDEVQKSFNELVTFIADPYHPVPEDDIKEFINSNQYHWDIIYSSGIISKRTQFLQEEYYFEEEYQAFIEKYISKLKSNFHGNYICKADKFWLEKLEEELKDLGQNIKLQNITDLRDQKNLKGYICNENGRVIELRLWKFQLPYFPNSILKLLGLEKLDLKINKFVRIPKSIGNLKYLKNLDLSQNQLKNLPSSMLGLESLEYLNLESNKLERLDSWWHDFKKLEYVCIYNNRFDEKNQNPILIDYIDDGLNFKDVITPKYIKENINNELKYLYVKDAVVINYLLEEKNINKEITYHFEFDDFRIKLLILTNPSSLKPLFWSLERLETLEIVNRSIQFHLNNSIKKLKFSVPNKFDSNLSLEIHDTISLLKNLETLHIEGFTSIRYPKNLGFLSNIKKLIIDTPKIDDIPFFLLELQIFPNVIINSHSKEINFNPIIENDNVQEPQILLTYQTHSELPELVIDKYIKNLYLSTRFFSSNIIEIKGILKKVLITPIRTISIEHFKSGDLWKPAETGNCIFVYEISASKIPEIKCDFSNLTHFRFEHLNITNLSHWMFESPHIEKLIITTESLPFSIQETFKEENKGLFQFRISAHCRIPEIEIKLPKLTNFQIFLPQLYKLPNFISNLSQFKQLIITSKVLDDVIAPFHTDENKYRLLFNVANSCEFPRFLLQMKQLTHVWIDLPNLIKLPADFELYFTDTKKIKFYIKKDIEESIVEYLKIPDPHYYIIKVHPSCVLPIFDDQIVYKDK